MVCHNSEEVIKFLKRDKVINRCYSEHGEDVIN